MATTPPIIIGLTAVWEPMKPLATLADDLHQRGMRLILDGVFNHVGRDFWAFRDVRHNLGASPYCDWFTGLDFSRRSSRGDPFTYEGWAGHDDLVRLNLENRRSANIC